MSNGYRAVSELMNFDHFVYFHNSTHHAEKPKEKDGLLGWVSTLPVAVAMLPCRCCLLWGYWAGSVDHIQEGLLTE